VTADRDELASIVLEYTQGSKLAALHQADALMPVVEKIAERRSLERAAQELRAAAAGVIDRADRIDILARATALDGKP
jgi:hypothetical protein